MAYAHSFLRLIMRWQLPGGEVANVTCSWTADSGIVSLDDATVDALALRATNFWTAYRAWCNNNVAYVGSSVEWVAPSGSILQRGDRPVDPNGGASTNNPCPNEVALVVSLRTAIAGRSTRGRMYLPGLQTGLLTSQGRWDTTKTAGTATAAAAMLAPLTVGSAHFTAVVASATHAIFTPVTQVGVGDVPDSQRRRRNKLIEAYATHSVP